MRHHRHLSLPIGSRVGCQHVNVNSFNIKRVSQFTTTQQTHQFHTQNASHTTMEINAALAAAAVEAVAHRRLQLFLLQAHAILVARARQFPAMVKRRLTLTAPPVQMAHRRGGRATLPVCANAARRHLQLRLQHRSLQQRRQLPQ